MTDPCAPDAADLVQTAVFACALIALFARAWWIEFSRPLSLMSVAFGDAYGTGICALALAIYNLLAGAP